MAQQVTMERALEAFERRLTKYVKENVLLEARVADLEAENAELRGQQPPAADSEQGRHVRTLPAGAEQTPGAAGDSS